MDRGRRTLLMIGKTGAGKSRLGNSILGMKAFDVSSRMTSLTKDVQSDCTEIEDVIVKVVDAPGIMDTEKKNEGDDQETAGSNMVQALAMCDGGVDAFLFVYKYGNRFTKEEREALLGIKNIFGDEFFKHVIVVVTFGDQFVVDMEDEGTSDLPFLEWCKKQTGAFLQLFNDCNGRMILFNNREENKNTMKTQVGEILKLANQLHEVNGRYTSQVFQEAKELREKYIIQKKAPILREDIQEQCGLLMGNLQSYMKEPNDVEKEKIMARINDMRITLQKVDKGTGLLKDILDIVDRVEKSLNDIDQLQILSEKLEKIRLAKHLWRRLGIGATTERGTTALVAGASALTAAIRFTRNNGGIAVAAVAAVGLGVAAAVNYVFHWKEEKKLEKDKEELKQRLRKHGLDDK